MVQVTVPGTRSRFTFTHDAFGNVRRATLPSGGVYEVTRFVATGFVRTIVQSPSGAKTAVDHDDAGNILMTSSSGEERTVAYRYDSHGHLAAILHDKRSVRMIRDPRTGELASVVTDDVTTRWRRNGPLVESVIVTSRAPNRDAVTGKFDFEFDSNFRLSVAKATVNGTSLAEDRIRYDDVSGKVTSFGAFSVLYYRMNMYVVSSRDVMYTKEHDYSGRAVKVELDVYR